jgi:hypothetical protein
MLQPKITSVMAMPNLQIQIGFQTGETGLFDVSPYVEGSWYGRLGDPEYFKTVHIIDDGYGIAWADGQDIAPHELYESVLIRAQTD